MITETEFANEVNALVTRYPVSLDDALLAVRWSALLADCGVQLPELLGDALPLSVLIYMKEATGSLEAVAEMCVPPSRMYPSRVDEVGRYVTSFIGRLESYEAYQRRNPPPVTIEYQSSEDEKADSQ